MIRNRKQLDAYYGGGSPTYCEKLEIDIDGNKWTVYPKEKDSYEYHNREVSLSLFDDEYNSQNYKFELHKDIFTLNQMEGPISVHFEYSDGSLTTTYKDLRAFHLKLTLKGALDFVKNFMNSNSFVKEKSK